MFIQGVTLAQQESNNWYFGSNAGVTFSSGSPVAVTNGVMTAVEGCSAISDSAGNLLFYTNGESVWNRNHMLMPNGNNTLNGSNAATQNAIIVPKPNNLSAYYIFTVDADGGPNGLSYSEVDMSLAGGLGDVIITTINTQLLPSTSEKVTAVKHYNLRDYWVITHKLNSTEFDAFLISPSGVSPFPVASLVGSTHGGASSSYSHGYMKASTNGHKVGLAITSPNAANTKAEVFDFDNNTGVLSNPITLSGFTFTVYGVEFSPDSHLMYVSTSSNPVNIHQFNLLAGNASQVNLSGQIPVATYNGFVYALQLGLDGKIYGSQAFSSFLAVINTPDVVGSGCGFTPNAVSLNGRMAQGGLPNFIQSNFIHADYNYVDTCFNNATQFTVNFDNPDSVRWDFGDPLSGNNTSTDTIVTHNFSAPAVYNVTLIVYYRALTDTVTKSINILPLPSINFGSDTILCAGQILTLNAMPSGATSFLWQDNSTGSFFNVDTTGMYYVLLTLNGCNGGDTINVTQQALPVINLGPDITTCDDQIPILLNAFNAGATYQWQDGTTLSTYSVIQSGIYTVTVTQNNCINIDTVIININISPFINFGPDTSICEGQTLFLDASASGAASYSWQDNSTANSFSVDTTGTYFVELTLNGCTGGDTINVVDNPVPTVNLGRDTTLCGGSSPFQLNAQNAGASFMWQDGSTAQTFNVLISGTYTVTVTINHCSNSDEANINISETPVVFLGNDTTICEGFQLFFNVTNDSSTYQWNDGYIDPTRFIDTLGTYAVTVINNHGCSAFDMITIDLQFEPMINLGEDTSLCSGQPIKLDATNYGATYQWQDNSTSATFTPASSGIYGVSATNQCGIASDSISIEFRECNCLVYVPKSFTPNSDYKNDLFNFKYNCSQFEVYIRIFNRIGQLMFQSNNPEMGWDGTYNGKPAEEGIYVYQLRYSGYDNGKLDAKTERGTFLLLR